MKRRHAAVAVCALVAGLVPAMIVPAAHAAQPAADAPAQVTAASAVTGAPTPAPVTGLTVRPSGSSEHLSWSNPVGSGYSAIVIRRAPGDIGPSTPASGTAVGRLAPGRSSFDDATAQPGVVYSYSVFASYPTGRSSAVVAHAALAPRTTVQPQTFGGGSITGTVTDEHGHPLGGVSVTATAAAPVAGISFGFGFALPHTAQTSADGSFDIGHLTDGSYQLCFSASTEDVTGGDNDQLGYDDFCLDDYVAGVAQTVTHVPPVALADNAGGMIDGVVRSAATGKPIAGVQVSPEFSGPEFFSVYAITDAHGAFHFALPAGDYPLCVDASFARVPSGGTGYISQCGRTMPTVTASPGVVTTTRIGLATGAAITGVVRDALDSTRLAYMDIATATRTGSYPETWTDSAGNYVLGGLPAGPAHLCADPFVSPTTAPSGFSYAPACVDVTAVRGATTRAADLFLSSAGGISGQVTSSDGVPLPGAIVEILGHKKSLYGTVTQADGTYSMPFVPAGNYIECFTALTYPTQCYRDKGPNDQPTIVHVVSGMLTQGISATLAAAAPGQIKVLVQDSSGHPLVGADAVAVLACDSKDSGDGCYPVSIFPRRNNQAATTVLTGASGTALLSGLAPGRYAVCGFGRQATRGGSSTRYQDSCTGSDYTLVVRSGATTQATLTLASAGGVSGTVTDSHGHPLAGVLVTVTTGDLIDSDQALPGMVTAPDGTYRIVGLPAGTTTVCFDASRVQGSSPTGYANQCYQNSTGKPTPVAISTGVVTAGIDAQIADGGAIAGTVTDPDGNPLAGVEVDAVAKTGGFAVTAADGTYEIIGLEPGRYQVCFEPEIDPGTSPTGYVGTCLGQTGSSPGAPVKVTSGHVTTGVDVALEPGGEITGAVTAGGQPLPEGDVELQGVDDGGIGEGTSFDGGTYELDDVPPGTYQLCFDGTISGDLAQCYDHVAWLGEAHPFPRRATTFTVDPGQVVTINADLTPPS